MPMLDIFNSDAFSVDSLRDAFIKLPFQPSRIGDIGLFRGDSVTTTTVVIEEKDGLLSLIQTSQRGGPADTIGDQKRTVRSFVVPHLERESLVLADELQNVRAFGSETDVEVVQNVVNRRLMTLRAMHEVTLEHMRVGAIKGTILDADGSTVLYNLFTEFGVSQQAKDIELSTSTTDVRAAAVAIMRLSEGELGGKAVNGYRAFCGDEFFDELVGHAEVKESLKYQESLLMRVDNRGGFEYGGITWENYRGSVGGVSFFPTAEAYVVPVGTSDVFTTYFAPADFMETVNTLGEPIYAKIFTDPEDRFAKIHTQSNPLPLCLRPRAVIKVTKS